MIMAEYKLQYTATEIDERLRKVDEIDSKVDKVSGMGLSANDFTDEYKAKVDSALQSYTETDPTVPAWAKAATKPTYTASEVGALPDTTTIPAALADLIDDSTHRIVTDAEKAAWNAKSNFSGNYNDLTDKPAIPSIEGLATETYVDEAISELANASHNHDDMYYTESEIDSKLSGKADSNHNHSYNDLTDKPSIPSIEGLATETYVNEQIATIPTPDVSGQIGAHNIATDSHSDIRETIAANTSAIELLTNGVSAEEVDGVNDLIQYVKDHGGEVTGMKADIKANADAIAAIKDSEWLDSFADVEANYYDKTWMQDNYYTGAEINEMFSSAEDAITEYVDEQFDKAKIIVVTCTESGDGITGTASMNSIEIAVAVQNGNDVCLIFNNFGLRLVGAIGDKVLFATVTSFSINDDGSDPAYVYAEIVIDVNGKYTMSLTPLATYEDLQSAADSSTQAILDINNAIDINAIPEGKTILEMISDAQDAAEGHADSLNSAMNTRVEALEAVDHEHDNKTLLDTYTQTEANIADAVAKKHEHANADVLNGISAEKVSAWDAAEGNAKAYANEQIEAAKAFLVELDKETGKASATSLEIFIALEEGRDVGVMVDGAILRISYIDFETVVVHFSDVIAIDSYYALASVTVGADGTYTLKSIELADKESVDASKTIVITLGIEALESQTAPMTGPEIIEALGTGHDVLLNVPLYGIYRVYDSTWDGKTASFYTVDIYDDGGNQNPVFSEIRIDENGRVTSRGFNLATKENVDAIEGRVETLEAIDHEHANKTELDLIVSGDKAKWDTAAGKAHTHTNESALNGISAEKIVAWDAAEQNAKDYVDEQVENAKLILVTVNQSTGKASMTGSEIFTAMGNGSTVILALEIESKVAFLSIYGWDSSGIWFSLEGWTSEGFGNLVACIDDEGNIYTEQALIPTLNGLTDIIDNHNTDGAAHADIREAISTKADLGHNHDDRYYTEAEINDMLDDAIAAIPTPVVYQSGAPTDTSVIWVDTDDEYDDGLSDAINVALERAKASGLFDGEDGSDGVSPTVTVSNITGGRRITITDKNSTKNIDVMDGSKGDKGDAGTSVTVKSVSESTADGGSNVVTFSDNNTITIKNGSKGSSGSDGVSPTVAVSKSGKVTTVSITDKNGTKTATINDGADGDAGKDGTSVTVKSVSESSVDGGSNIITFSDGKTVTIKNGNKGKDGLDATPVAPLFANTIEECTETDKMYVLPDGFIYAYMETEVVGGVSYTNLVPTSTDTDGSIYNGTGYKENVRLSSSGSISGSAQNGSVTTGFIPWTSCGVVRIKGAIWQMFDNEHYYLNFYAADKSFIYGISSAQCIADAGTGSAFSHITTSYDETTGITIIDTSSCANYASSITDAAKNAAYFRLNAKGKGTDLIVTVNEEIKEATSTTSYAWTNTGHAFVQADYEDRIIALEDSSEDVEDRIVELEQRVENIVDGTTNIAASTKFDPTVYNLPVLYLTGDTSPIAVSKDNTVTLSYVYGERSGTCTLKGQGSSSYKMAKAFIEAGKAGKFNYTIKFDNAFEAAEGWTSQKKYCLKANWIDSTHSRNVVSAKLWGQIVKSRTTTNTLLSGLVNGGAIDGFPIVIMLNDEFHGLYTFNIPKDGWMFGMEEDATKTQAIVCAKDHTTATQFKTAGTSGFEVEFASDEDNVGWITTSLTRLISACVNSNGSDLDTTIAQYLDWDSAIDYYIFIVLLKGLDMIDKNYLLTTFDGTKWHFSAYDIDSTYGLNWDASGLSRAVSNCSFAECADAHKVWELIKKYKASALKARYEQLRKNILSETRICNYFENFAWDIALPIALEDVKKYPTIRGSSVNGIDQICRWIRQRLEVTDEWINAL